MNNGQSLTTLTPYQKEKIKKYIPGVKLDSCLTVDDRDSLLRIADRKAKQAEAESIVKELVQKGLKPGCSVKITGPYLKQRGMVATIERITKNFMLKLEGVNRPISHHSVELVKET